eukprot:4534560-Alexandrium_andersonii.AAC.1
MTCCRASPRCESCIRGPPMAEMVEACCTRRAPPNALRRRHGPRKTRCLPTPHGRRIDGHGRAGDGQCCNGRAETLQEGG